ncbi:hypothetical protein GDO81_020972 [Engystomops pustulosus]|uniref:Uncharacterized protein n=1 Tax=Engystomops pustulosus TaxID=76066 RepID=A0AAV6YZH2_ENGPU|nr:hypothetical protein GDO81_020972 [Engystomops pustulosus]
MAQGEINPHHGTWTQIQMFSRLKNFCILCIRPLLKTLFTEDHPIYKKKSCVFESSSFPMCFLLSYNFSQIYWLGFGFLKNFSKT